MFRSLSTFARTTAVLVPVCAGLALPTTLRAQADTRPVLVVFEFNNNSIGKDHADYDGVRTGIQDLLITSLAGNPKYRVVDRAHLNQVLQEQNLAKDGQVDNATAVKIGKILGAQYAVTGGLMSNGRGMVVMNSYTIDLSTSQIQNPDKILGSADDILGLLDKAATAIGSQIKLAPVAAGRMGDAGAAIHKDEAAPSSAASVAVQSGTPAHEGVELYARPMKRPFPKTKLDVTSAKLYTRALDAMDARDNDKAVELFKQVLAKNPNFTPASENLEKLGVSVTN
jgi:TolB-like protein